ncbi:hypothetical protein [Alkaliphilus transvaalensis]|uniref:hypothetical protein n=1 Tax=Alkaliphilus transvaalensis TaxID=114628 RepID=UPI00047D795A|nr:hypothetical protein [Alkaliphilus transvaalensis]
MKKKIELIVLILCVVVIVLGCSNQSSNEKYYLIDDLSEEVVMEFFAELTDAYNNVSSEKIQDLSGKLFENQEHKNLFIEGIAQLANFTLHYVDIDFSTSKYATGTYAYSYKLRDSFDNTVYFSLGEYEIERTSTYYQLVNLVPNMSNDRLIKFFEVKEKSIEKYGTDNLSELLGYDTESKIKKSDFYSKVPEVIEYKLHTVESNAYHILYPEAWELQEEDSNIQFIPIGGRFISHEEGIVINKVEKGNNTLKDYAVESIDVLQSKYADLRLINNELIMDYNYEAWNIAFVRTITEELDYYFDITIIEHDDAFYVFQLYNYDFNDEDYREISKVMLESLVFN